MAFLDWLADWAEKNIPTVGSYIADLVRYLQSSIEEWTSIWRYYSKVVYTWFEKVRQVIDDFIADPYSFIATHLPRWLYETIDWLTSNLSGLKKYVEGWVTDSINQLNNLASNLWEYVYDTLTDTVDNITKSFEDFKTFIYNLVNNVQEWINNADEWFLQQLDNAKELIWNYIKPFVEPIIDIVTQINSVLSEFIKDPIGYITKAVQPMLQQVYDALNQFSRWVEDQINNARSAILGIDEFLKQKLFEFIAGFVTWFLWSFLYDLATLFQSPVLGAFLCFADLALLS